MWAGPGRGAGDLRVLIQNIPQEGTVAMSALPASPDFSLLSFVADSQALVMLFSNGTVQVSDQGSFVTQGVRHR